MDELDSVLRCPACAGEPYRVFLRPREGAVVKETVVRPTPAGPLVCRSCDVPLKRVSA
jgi:hypothetical protein